MKILHIITSLKIGGAEKLVTEMLPRLAAKGHQVDLVLFDGSFTPLLQFLEGKECRIYKFSIGGNVYNPLFIFKLIPLLRQYDIVHTHNTAPQLFAAIANKLCSVVLCTTEHTTSNRRRDWKWYALFDRWMYNQYKKIICISSKAEENLRTFHPKLKADILTIENGIDVASFYQAPACQDLRKGSKPHVLIMVAGFRYQKDQDTLIRALSLLNKEQYELWLVGDGERRQALEQLTRELDLTENVRFWGIRTDIPTLLHTADIVVMSSHFEGLSLSSIEGMAVGKPFIASDVDGLHDTTVGAGLLFPKGNETALAEQIQKLTKDYSFYQQIATACYERARQFDIQKTVNSYTITYQDLSTQNYHESPN